MTWKPMLLAVKVLRVSDKYNVQCA